MNKMLGSSDFVNKVNNSLVIINITLITLKKQLIKWTIHLWLLRKIKKKFSFWCTF